MGFDFLGLVSKLFGPAPVPASWILAILPVRVLFRLSQLELGSSHLWSRQDSRVLPGSDAPPDPKSGTIPVGTSENEVFYFPPRVGLCRAPGPAGSPGWEPPSVRESR